MIKAIEKRTVSHVSILNDAALKVQRFEPD